VPGKSDRAAELDYLIRTERPRIDDGFLGIEKEEARPGMVSHKDSIEEGEVPAIAGNRADGVSHAPGRDTRRGRHPQNAGV
jgi:hypothetical protein